MLLSKIQMGSTTIGGLVGRRNLNFNRANLWLQNWRKRFASTWNNGLGTHSWGKRHRQKVSRIGSLSINAASTERQRNSKWGKNMTRDAHWHHNWAGWIVRLRLFFGRSFTSRRWFGTVRFAVCWSINTAFDEGRFVCSDRLTQLNGGFVPRLVKFQQAV